MEPSCKVPTQENPNDVKDLMDDNEEDSGISHTPSALHILDLPDSVIFQILVYLPFSSIGAIAQVCSRFSRISSDELLWRHVFMQHYKLPASTIMPAKARSWRQEFKRLYYHTPAVLSEERKEHKDEVLHVSFSHDGTMFATCSKDGFFKVWECTHPVRLLFKMDMKSTFSWKFTQFSQFNETDTCLLVSGVYFGRLSTSGEIAVFNLQDDFRMQCRVTNKPYDVFGAWYDNDHLLSGTLYWTGDFNSVSAVWLSKASQEVESEVESVSMVLYRFENVNSSSIRLLHVAEVDRDSDTTESIVDKEELETSESGQTSPRSSSLGFGDEGKITIDLDPAKSRPEVEVKGQGQNTMPKEESCLLDMLLQRCIAEDEFDIENEDMTDDDGENGDFNMELDLCKGPDLINGTEELNKATDFNKMTCTSNVADNIKDIDSRPEDDIEITDSRPDVSSSDICFVQHKVVSMQGDDHGSTHDSSIEALLSSHPETSSIIIEPDLAHLTSGSQSIDRSSHSVHNLDCNPSFRFPEEHLSTFLPSTETATFKIPQCTVVTGSKISKQNAPTSGSTSSNEHKDNPPAMLTTTSLDNPIVLHSNTTDNSKIPAQEIQSATTVSDSPLSRPSLFPLLDFLADKTDLETRSAISRRTMDTGLTRSPEASNASCEIDGGFMPENAMEVVGDHVILPEDDLSMDVLNSVSDNSSLVDGALPVASRIHDTLHDGALSWARITHDTLHNGTLSGASITDDTLHDGAFSGASIIHDNLLEGTLSGASITHNTLHDGTLSGASVTPESVYEDVCVNASECSKLSIHPAREMINEFEGASESINEPAYSDPFSENKPGARDVSQQFGQGLGSRDASLLNVPSMYDNNNLVMLIPGASHVYGIRNVNNANINNNNISNNHTSEAESSSHLESDVLSADVLTREAGIHQSHKSSIATQTEVASSRASSFHSLSHMSQSSSISRDFRCSPPREKLLIYTWGSETYIPHKVGIKRMKWTDFTKVARAGEVTARRSSMLLPDVMENLHNMAGNRRDKPDVTIEMHGHIVGLSLSPDHKYLYVNCRPWPKNYIISDPQDSPPLAQEVEISTIDLTTFNFVGPVLRSHKAYTHSDECFFLNLDVSDDYVASGAEDRQGYLWDRHYGIPLYRFPHRNVVNCVAINPQDSEILVTVSDDYTFKVWMSRCRASELTGSNDANKGTSV